MIVGTDVYPVPPCVTVVDVITPFFNPSESVPDLCILTRAKHYKYFQC